MVWVYLLAQNCVYKTRTNSTAAAAATAWWHQQRYNTAAVLYLYMDGTCHDAAAMRAGIT